jgi:hypothetical protein
MAMNESARGTGTGPGAVADVTRTVEDYFLGWYDADPDPIRRALHPDLAKRSFLARADGPPLLRAVTATLMIGWAEEGEGRETDPAKRRLQIVVDEVHGSIANARVDSELYREYIHLARTPNGWRIVNTLWTWTDPDRREA